MNPVIKIFDSIEDQASFFFLLLVTAIHNSKENRPISVALSGGSTPKRIFEYLATNCRDLIDWKKILVFWGDERCVSPENLESNFRMARESLLDHVPIEKSNIFRIMGETDPNYEAGRYSEIVCQRVASRDNIPSFDIFMLGLGEDGHTASIFPDSLHLLVSDKLYEVAENPSSGQKRITATMKIINHSRTVVFFANGMAKAEIVARVIGREQGWERLPAAMVNPGKGDLLWLLDKDAALYLSNNS